MDTLYFDERLCARRMLCPIVFSRDVSAGLPIKLISEVLGFLEVSLWPHGSNGFHYAQTRSATTLPKQNCALATHGKISLGAVVGRSLIDHARISPGQIERSQTIPSF